MKESLRILELAFADEPFSFRSKRFELPEIEITPLSVRSGGPEIWMGAFAPPAIEGAARLADGFLAFTPTGLAENFEACDRIGRPRELHRGPAQPRPVLAATRCGHGADARSVQTLVLWTSLGKKWNSTKRTQY